MIFARNAQEAGDFCLIARRAAEATQTPFFNVQDGFLTTHTVETVRLPEPEFMKEYIGDPKEKLINLMDPANPMMSGVVQNQDSYMKGKIAQRWYYDRVEPALEEAFERVRAARPAASTASSSPTAARTPTTSSSAWAATWRRPRRRSITCASKGIEAGCLTVFVFRPFPARQIVEALKDCKAFTVFERMDDPLSTTGNHLTREIKAAFCDAVTGQNGQDEDRPRAADLPRRRRPGQPRRAARRHHRRLPQHDAADGQDFFCVGIDHPLALKRAGGPGPAAARAASRCAATRSAASAR